MGLGDTTAVKNMLKMRAPSGWLNRDMLKSDSVREDVTFVISDFLLDVHRLAHNPKLTYEGLVAGIQRIVLNFVMAFPNIDTIIFLLDEQRYVPLGKVPTQTKRKKPLTASERAKLLDGGVISNMDPSLHESIDAIYSKESSVRDGKNTPFSVFFERYIRTRELRKDLVVFITNCLTKMIESKMIPDHIRIYIDGMSVSTYYSSPDLIFSATEAEDGTPLVKKRRSLSSTETVNRHKHEDDVHLSVCKLAWTTNDYSLSLTPDHPSSSLATGSLFPVTREKKVKPLWLRREDGDSEIFMGYKGPYARSNMGESDIKISYYVRRLTETLMHQMKCSEDNGLPEEEEEPVGCTCFVSSCDTDILVILLLCVNLIPSSVARCFDILLDTNVGGSTKEIIALHESSAYTGSSGTGASSQSSGESTSDLSGVYSHALGRVVGKEEGEYLTNIANILALSEGIKHYFRELHPGVKNAVETLCLLLLLTGSDYVESLPGIGFEKLRTTFDLGGYLFLSEAISIYEKVDESPMFKGEKSLYNGRVVCSAKRLTLNLDEFRIKAFLNLVYRYSIGIGPLRDISKELKREKTRLTSESKKKDKAIQEIKHDEYGEQNHHLRTEDYEKVERIRKEKVDIDRQRDFLNNFLPQKYYTALTNAFNKESGLCHIQKTLGITATGRENEDWIPIEKEMKAKRIERITRKRKSLITRVNKDKKLTDEKKRTKLEEIRNTSDRDILSGIKKELSDLESNDRLDPFIRRVGWNIAYWLFSPFVCPRETKHLNSMCRLDPDKEEVIQLLSRAKQQEKESSKNPESENNHRMEEYFSPKPYPKKSNKESLSLPASRTRKRKISLNGFLRVYEDILEENSGKGTSGTKKARIVHSKQIFPASRVVIDLLESS
jgi:hypothetical protein